LGKLGKSRGRNPTEQKGGRKAKHRSSDEKKGWRPLKPPEEEKLEGSYKKVKKNYTKSSR